VSAAGAGCRLALAMFPRGLDGLFLPPVDGVEVYGLVESGTPEHHFVQQQLPASQVLPYRLTRDDLGIYPTTEELLVHSDIAAVLAARGVTALLLSCSCSDGIWDWAQRHRIRLVMADPAHRRFEDKLWFDAFLRRQHLPRPRGGAVTLGSRMRLPTKIRGAAVLQRPDSMGGEGTFFVEGEAGIRRLLEQGRFRLGEKALLRERIHGQAYGITVLVAPSVISLSPIRLQCYFPKTDVTHGQCFAGIQWVPPCDLPAALNRRIARTFGRMGQLLYQRRYFGVANFDFMVDDRSRIFVIECNPRMSAATPQLLYRRELSPRVPVGELLLRGLAAPRRYSRERSCVPPPATAYRGATLDLVHRQPAPDAALVQRTFPSGHYELRADEVHYLGPSLRELSLRGGFALFSYARAGQRCRHDEPLGSILSNEPLFDRQGALLPRAQRLIDHFKYTDDRSGS